MGWRLVTMAAGIALAAALAGCNGPGVDQLAAGPTGVVTEVRTGDTVVLKGGRVVRLAGMEAPKGSDPFAGEAREALSKLVLGKAVQLMYGGARQDAYGRTLAQLKLAKGGAWVEKALLEAGDARVHTWPDNRALARSMLDAEPARASRGAVCGPCRPIRCACRTRRRPGRSVSSWWRGAWCPPPSATASCA